MSSSDISFSGRTVSVSSQTWQAPWPVKNAVLIHGRVILLYDYMAGPPDKEFRNLEAFSFSGQKLWTAEHTSSHSAYVEIMSIDPFVACDFDCFRCVIDPANGRLIASQFTK
jgi:hypothetical protein